MSKEKEIKYTTPQLPRPKYLTYMIRVCCLTWNQVK